MRASINIETCLSSRTAGKHGDWTIATCLVTSEYNGQPYSDKVQILAKSGDLPVGRLDIAATVNISLRRGSGDYPPSLSIVLVSLLRKTSVA